MMKSSSGGGYRKNKPTASHNNFAEQICDAASRAKINFEQRMVVQDQSDRGMWTMSISDLSSKQYQKFCECLGTDVRFEATNVTFYIRNATGGEGENATSPGHNTAMTLNGTSVMMIIIVLLLGIIGGMMIRAHS
jgi:hypothetical protein